MNSYDIDFKSEEIDMNVKKVGNNGGGVATEIKAVCGVFILGVGGGLFAEVLKSREVEWVGSGREMGIELRVECVELGVCDWELVDEE